MPRHIKRTHPPPPGDRSLVKYRQGHKQTWHKWAMGSVGLCAMKQEDLPVCSFSVTLSTLEAWVKTSEEIPNDNSKNLFIRIYSPCNKMGKTHCKHFDKADMEWRLVAQREMVLSSQSSMKYTELYPVGNSGCPHSALISPMYWMLTPQTHVVLRNECYYLSLFHRSMN